jgi:peptidoglycan hydrolase CwlO-like protein
VGDFYDSLLSYPSEVCAMSEMFDHNPNNGETSEPKKGDFSEVEFLRKRIKELEAEVHGLRSQIASTYEKIADTHEKISNHLRWVNGVFALFITILLGGSIASFAWFRQQAMEQISFRNDKLQTMIYDQVKSLRFTIEQRLENFGKDWSERLYKVEDRLNSLEKRLR